MRNLTATLCLTLAVLLFSPTEGWSADFQKGLDAARSGDFATALRELKPLAEQGHADAQFNLGVMYENGLGVPQDNKTAGKWYRLAAEQENALAQYNLGLMYYNGRGVPQDNKTAVKWYTLAAEQGIVYAHMWGNLGASNGNETGGKLRDFVAKEMTPADISTALELARECVRKNYKGC